MSDSNNRLSSFSRADNAENVIVLDSFLGNERRHELWESLLSHQFNYNHDEGFERVFRLYDGNSLYGQHTILKRRELRSSASKEGRNIQLPDGCNSVEANLIQSVLGDPCASRFLSTLPQWRSITLQSFIYPVGAGLSWHDDSEKLANFLYYPHPEWDANWGGELLVSASPADGDSLREMPSLYKHDDNRVLETGLGTFIMPKPDRLIMIRSGISHCIKKVDAAAGMAFRASYSGFVYS
jgi:hypothetical protein